MMNNEFLAENASGYILLLTFSIPIIKDTILLHYFMRAKEFFESLNYFTQMLHFIKMVFGLI